MFLYFLCPIVLLSPLVQSTDSSLGGFGLLAAATSNCCASSATECEVTQRTAVLHKTSIISSRAEMEILLRSLRSRSANENELVSCNNKTHHIHIIIPHLTNKKRASD